MTTTSQLIAALSTSDFAMDLAYVSPTLHILLVSEIFQDLEDEVRMRQVLRYLESQEFSKESLSLLLRVAPISIDCFSPDEKNRVEILKNRSENSAPSSWVSWFNDEIYPEEISEVDLPTKFMHFYGYKGGQGRSTVLSLIAKSLANDGFRVLALDADVEAPSLDYLLGGRADDHSQTLMGLCGWSSQVRPVLGVHSGLRGGRVDLISCRSRQPEIDLDFAMFVASSPLDTRVLQAGATRLLSFLSNLSEPYDAVLIDHRTGMASSVLPLLRKLPGGTAIFARPDSNVSAMPSDLIKICRSILWSGIANKSFFVNFSLDPVRAKQESLDSAEAQWRETLSGELELAASEWDEESGTADNTEPLYSPAELSYRWVDWFLDRSLFGSQMPDLGRLQADNLDSLSKMRELVDLIGTRKQAQHVSLDGVIVGSSHTSVSGARDRGIFIQIPEVERLFVPSNPYTYILGRKGTGKTRLLHELARRGLGEPLMVAADENSVGGVQSGSVEATTWMDKCNRNPDVFWWSLLGIALAPRSNTITTLGEAIVMQLQLDTDPKSLADKLHIRRMMQQSSETKVLLIDGLETMVPAAENRELVAALFRLIATIQNDSIFAAKLLIRLFIREDLATGAVQNVEQQMDGRVVQLRWSAASILNFALSRLPTLAWIRSQYSTLCDHISSPGEGERISFGQLPEQEAVDLLLEVLPDRMRRNNLSTKTFLKLYFSDAGGDETNKAAFYPRLYTSFLGKLDQLCSTHSEPKNADGKIDSKLVNQAYDDAARDFIDETKLELVYLLSLDSENSTNEVEGDEAKVDRFIAAFEGMSTPFEYEDVIRQLAKKTGFTEGSVRASLLRMKSIRMFEDRPGFSGWWRVGQLFKMGLRMKYTR